MADFFPVFMGFIGVVSLGIGLVLFVCARDAWIFRAFKIARIRMALGFGYIIVGLFILYQTVIC